MARARRSGGRLPASVYWRRRLAVLGIVMLLIVGISRFFLNGSDASDDTATPVADEPTATVTVTPTPSAEPSKKAGKVGGGNKPAKPKSSAPPEPTGECSPSDIVVEPAVTNGYSYDNVTIPLQLRTVKATACTWKLSADALQVRISQKGGDLVWSTVDCPKAVPTKEIVVRRDVVTTLPLTWTGRRVVAGECTGHGPWVKPNFFTIVAAALGGEPSSATFGLYKPGTALSRTEPDSPVSR
ncbi:hypothetical protein ACWZJV_12520 [Nocardioides sp. WG-D5]|uniref:hypothetical protein n=1 Tax=Nocardioides luteus TaxID=1844 RepID=UPI000202946E|nr:hypothetical protein [Nocardioides luteus]EGD45383.1 hypothetical protein NBCG_00195 [Nocardioidaceae bacterium Broad-1]MBG6094138.1 hypothetical protein [Nocardioides luteus]